MNDVTKSQSVRTPSSELPNEDALLDSVLHGSDRLLADSLRVDELRRRRRKLVSIALLLGGIVMGTVLVAMVAGWLTLALPPQADARGEKPAAVADKKARVAQAEDLTKQGWQLWSEQRFGDAIQPFEEAVELDPESAAAWNGLGWARFNSGNAQGAIEPFEKCVALEPKHAGALNGLGQIYLNQGEFDKAERFLLKSAATPSADAAYFGLGRLYLLTGKFDKAQTWIKKALKNQPNEPMLAAMMNAAKQKELSNELRAQIAPAGKPDSAPAAQAAAEGWQDFNRGKFRSAELSFRSALAKDPENGAALNGLGFCLLNSGKASEAKPYFEKCIELDPNAAGAMNGLARCLKEESKVEEAIAVWEKMAKKFPGPNAASVGLATTYSEQGEYAKALPLFEELVKSQPQNEEFKEGLKAAQEGAKTAKPKE